MVAARQNLAVVTEARTVLTASASARRGSIDEERAAAESCWRTRFEMNSHAPLRFVARPSVDRRSRRRTVSFGRRTARDPRRHCSRRRQIDALERQLQRILHRGRRGPERPRGIRATRVASQTSTSAHCVAAADAPGRSPVTGERATRWTSVTFQYSRFL